MQGHTRKTDAERWSDSSSTPSRRTLGKYEIVEQIGEGGFGVVYKGFDPFIKRHVAIKTCSSPDRELRGRYFREAEIAGRLDHPNVVRIFDFGIEDKTPFLVQEFLPGQDLDQKIEGHQFVPYPERLLYLIHIARGLEYAHGQGIIHRDIKPANIRILEDGTAKIMDFGVARLQHTETRLTKDGVAIGSAAYLAPEQIRGEPTTHRTDIFSYGVLAFELLAGERPFERDSIPATLFSILNDDPRTISLPAPMCPQAMRRFIYRCLEKDPRRRFASFSEILAELDRVREQMRAHQDGRDFTAELRRVNRAGPARTTEPARVAVKATARRTVARPESFDPPIRHEWTPPSIRLRQRRRWWTVTALPVTVVALAALGYGVLVDQGVLRWPFAGDAAERIQGPDPRLAAPPTPQQELLSAQPSPTKSTAVERSDARPATPQPGGPTNAADSTPAAPPSAGASPRKGDRQLAGGSEPRLEARAEVENATLRFSRGWNRRMTVSVDGGPPLSLADSRSRTLGAGEHTLTFSLKTDDYRAVKTVSVRLDPGETRTVQSPIARPGQLTVQASLGSPQGVVRLDGKMLGSSPLRGVLLAPGEHRLQIYGFDDPTRSRAETPVEIRSLRETVVTFDLNGERELAVRQRELGD